MSVMPVSAVSFGANNNSNLNFSGRKNKVNYEHCEDGRCSSMPLKSIPVAAMIAMSPMANVNNVYAKEPMEPRVEMVAPLQPEGEVSEFIAKPKSWNVVGKYSYNDEQGYPSVILNLIDTNKDGDFELVEMIKKGRNFLFGEGVVSRMIVTKIVVEDSGVEKCAGVQLGPDLTNFAPIEEPQYFYYADYTNERIDEFDPFAGHYEDGRFCDALNAMVKNPHNNCARLKVERCKPNTDGEENYGEADYERDLRWYKSLLKSAR